MKKLPIGKQSFISIREGKDTVYIDKTKYIYNLIITGTKPVYFLSRPRRFGKSLLIDTIRCLFEGKKELFEGLYIYDKWNWEEKYPVIKIAFGDGNVENREYLKNNLEYIIKTKSDEEELEINGINIADKFKDLIKKLYEKTGKQVVVLVDEYDKPILDKIEDIKNANEIKDELKGFYSVLKGADEYLRFVILTGVTKFSKVSVFSGLNNLNDITLNDYYNSICGYTINEIKENFGPEGYLEGLDYEKMKNWYNGYSFGGTETLYNPFGLLNFFYNKNKYSNYWFQTATPTFLLKLLKQQNYPLLDFENLEVGEEITGSFDIERLELATLMFQTGYLTIKEIGQKGDKIRYKLGIPNKEVRMSLNDYLVKEYIGFRDYRKNLKLTDNIYDSIEIGDVEGFISAIKRVYAGIPYSNYVKNDISKYEGFYGGVLYAFLTGAGIDFVAEDFTNRGRIDFSISYMGYIIIIELKVEKTGQKALEQIKERKYEEKYKAYPKGIPNSEARENPLGDKESSKKIILLGIDFDEEEKNVGSYEYEIL